MKKLLLITVLTSAVYFTGCFPASRTEEDNEQTTETTDENKNEEKVETGVVSETGEANGAAIMRTAASEQNKKMYSPKVDSTYLYWLNNQLIVLNGSTKCNIFALNVLYKSGFKTPKQNALCRDLYNTSNFTDILPVVVMNDVSDIKKGDLIIWKGHVIIFEELVKSKTDTYCMAWWAGTRQKDNGENIRNNVIYGKYKISGDYVVRRPMKK